MNKYLCFEEIGETPKTKIYAVINKKTEFVLGIVKWYAPWRRYCLFVNDNVLFDAGCLTEIINFINKLMKERKEKIW